MVRLKTEAEMRKVRADAVREDSVEGHFVRMARKYRCKRRKNMGGMYGPEGWPDQVIVWPDGKGTTDWVELKRPKGGRFEPKQLQLQAELRACGARVETLYTKAEVNGYFVHRALELGVEKPTPATKRGLAALKRQQLSSMQPFGYTAAPAKRR